MAVCSIFDLFSQGSNKREGKKGEESIFKVPVSQYSRPSYAPANMIIPYHTLILYSRVDLQSDYFPIGWQFAAYLTYFHKASTKEKERRGKNQSSKFLLAQTFLGLVC